MAESFADLLRRFRGERRLTQEELGDRAQVSARTIREMERGSRRPRARNVEQIADALRLSGADRAALLDAGRERAWSGPDAAQPSGPRQLPAPPPAFVGRAKDLADLDATPAMVTVISGMAGVGKTALAVHWAHRRAHQFPDGQLYVNLRGYDAGSPVSPIDVVARFLRALEVPPHDVPIDLDEATALFRSRLDGKRVLVLLDNARRPEQIRPLLPGNPACPVVVTSRDRMTGLVALEHARRLDLEVLDRDDSVALLAELVAASDDAPQALERLAAACGNLPLALRIAGAFAADLTGGDIARYTDGLAINALNVEGDPAASVRAAFDRSYRTLPLAAQRAFRLLGEHPGPDIGLDAAGVLFDEPAEPQLETLAEAHLATYEGGARYSMHDLLRQFARDEPGPDAAAARSRLVHFYRRAAQAAGALLTPQMVTIPADGPAPIEIADAHAAGAWMDRELANLIALAGATDAADAWLIPDALRGYFWLRRFYPEWRRTAVDGLAAAEAAKDGYGRASMHISLGLFHRVRAEMPAAAEQFDSASAIAREIGWLEGQAVAANSMGVIHTELGQPRVGLTRMAEAIAIYRQVGRRSSEAVALANMGTLYAALGDLRAANDASGQALTLYRETDNLAGEAMMLCCLGINSGYLGQTVEGRALLEQGLAMQERLGDRYGAAVALIALGEIANVTGEHEEALARASAGLAVAREIDDPANTANALVVTAGAHNGRGDTVAATRAADEALSLARGVEASEPEIEALTALADAARGDGRAAQAVAYATAAAEIAAAQGYALLEGRALDALGAAHYAAGNPEAARATALVALDRHSTTGYAVGRRRAEKLLAATAPRSTST